MGEGGWWEGGGREFNCSVHLHQESSINSHITCCLMSTWGAVCTSTGDQGQRPRWGGGSGGGGHMSTCIPNDRHQPAKQHLHVAMQSVNPLMQEHCLLSVLLTV